MRGAGRYRKDERGAVAAEFAMVVLPFLALVFGIIQVSMMFYANHTMQYAAEGAARCASVMSTSTCNGNTAITTYAQGLYKGPNISPVFTPSTASCGHKVVATANFQILTGLVNTTVPLSTSACFP